jgi:hypothetical protein
MLDETTVQVVCHDVLYFSWSTGSNNIVLSVDPDGGPFLGENVEIGNNLKIKSIVNYDHDTKKALLTVTVDVVQS